MEERICQECGRRYKLFHLSEKQVIAILISDKTETEKECSICSNLGSHKKQ
jgi:hypothetical protein